MIFNHDTNIFFNIHLNEIPELTETSKLVYSALYTNAYITNQNILSKGGKELTSFTFTQKQLSEVLKITKSKISLSIKQLSELNLISVYLSDDKMKSYYKINDPITREQITEFNKYSEQWNEIKDGFSYNPIIVIPANIIQLKETASIRLAIAELQFAWMRKDDRDIQYYDTCNFTQAEKILHKNFKKSIGKLKEKGYINYEVSTFSKYKGFTNIQFNLNPRKEVKEEITETNEVVQNEAINETKKSKLQEIIEAEKEEARKRLEEENKQNQLVETNPEKETVAAIKETNKIDENQILNFLNNEDEKIAQSSKNYIIPFPKQYIENDNEDFSFSDLFKSESIHKLTEKDYEEMKTWAV